jgi:hypothetical protein
MSLDEFGEGSLIVLASELAEQTSIALLECDRSGDPATQLLQYRVPLETSHARDPRATWCQRIYAANRAVDYTFFSREARSISMALLAVADGEVISQALAATGYFDCQKSM